MFEQFKTASPARQIVVVVAAVAGISLFIALLWTMLFRTDYVPAFAQVQPSDAAKIVKELNSKKLPYRLDDGGATILVPAEQLGAARLAIASGDLGLADSVGFEIFNKSELGITDFAQKINFQRALQGELERTIATIDRVETARVHLALGEDRAFREDRVPPKAAVTLHMAQGIVPSAETVQGVQLLVAAAVPKLEPVDVVVVGDNGMVVSPARAEPTQDQSSPIAEEKSAIERFYQARVRGSLAGSFGAERFSIAVEAVLGPDVSVGQVPAMGADRNFPLEVSLQPDGQITADDMRAAQQLAGEAIGYRAELGDIVRIGGVSATPAVAARSNVLPPQASARQSSPDPHPVTGAEGGFPFARVLESQFALAGIAIAIVILIIVLLGKRPVQRLSEEERLNFSERLRHLMDEDTLDTGGHRAGNS